MIEIVLLVAAVAVLFLLVFYIVKPRDDSETESQGEITVRDNYLKLPKINRIPYPILYINLGRSSQRRQFMENQFKEFNIANYGRIEAVDGKLINYNGDDLGDIRFVNSDPVNKNSNAELGCTLSHIRAILHAYSNDLGIVVVMEDDASLELMPLWKCCLAEVARRAPADWELIKLQSCFDTELENAVDMDFGFVEDNTSGTVAYLINEKGQKKIRDLFHNGVLNLSGSPDVSADVYLYNVLHNYRTIPMILPHNDYNTMNSTIHTDHTVDHIGMSNTVKSLYVNAYKISSENYCKDLLQQLKNITDIDSLKAYSQLTPHRDKIPKLLHIIWIGNKDLPETLSSWTTDFCRKNPDWTLRLWGNSELENLNLFNADSYRKIPEMCGKADIARYEILYRFGGMYIDADTLWLNKPSPSLTRGLLNVAREDNGLILNGWFSCIPRHPFFLYIIHEIPFRDLSQQAWKCVGPTLVTDIYDKLKSVLAINDADINFVDIKEVLCPDNWHGIDYDESLKICRQKQAFAFHYGLSTNTIPASA